MATEGLYGIIPDLKTLVELRHYGKGIKFPPRRRVSGNLAGGFLSNIRGRGIDFDEVRQYNPGDDIRNMDWRVTARMDKPHTKVFKEERERPVFFAIDNSKSMQFGTRRVFKSVAAAEAATLLAWAANANKDRVGGLLFSEEQHYELKPTAGDRGVLRLINMLCRKNSHYQKPSALPSQDPLCLQHALQRLRHVVKPGSALFILSDFQNASDADMDQLAQLSIHNELYLIHVFDQIEGTPPPAGRYRISDGTNDADLDLESAANRKEYQTYFQQKRDKLVEFCKQRRVGYIPLCNATDLYSLAQSFVPQYFSNKEIFR